MAVLTLCEACPAGGSAVAFRQGESGAEVELEVQGMVVIVGLDAAAVIEVVAYARLDEDTPMSVDVDLNPGGGVEGPLWSFHAHAVA